MPFLKLLLLLTARLHQLALLLQADLCYREKHNTHPNLLVSVHGLELGKTGGSIPDGALGLPSPTARPVIPVPTCPSASTNPSRTAWPCAGV